MLYYKNGPSIKLQVLIYPVIEPDFETEAYRQYQEGHGLTRRGMQWFWEQYIGNRTPDVHAAPSRADSHNNLPPAHVITAEYDVLRDEGEAYADKRAASGVPNVGAPEFISIDVTKVPAMTGAPGRINCE